jgi:predicted MFS family arabinose efflux permease
LSRTEAVKAAASVSASRESAAFGPGYRRWLLFLLTTIYTSNFVDRQLLATLIQPIKKDLALTDTQLGLLIGLAFAAFYVLLGIPIARQVERKSRILVLTVCVAAWSLFTVSSGLARSFVQLAIARVGVGVGEAGCLPASHSLISDHYPPSRRATALSIWGLGIPIGSLIGAVAGGWIAKNVDWRVAFFAVGAPGLILAVLAPLTLKEPPRGLAEGADATAPTPPLWAVVKRLCSRPSALWVCGGATAGATAAYAILGFITAFFMRRYGLDNFQAGLATGAISGVGAGISILGGGVVTDWLAKRDLRAYAWVSVVGLVAAIPLFVFGLTRPDWPTALLLLFGGGAAQQLYLGPTYAIANNMVEPRMRATSIALYAAVWSLIGIGFGPAITGAISDRVFKALKADPSADILHLCRQAGCADASATGLQYAMICVVVLFAIAAVAFAMSARTMRRDLEAKG